MSNSYERNIRKYEMFINDKHYINKLINEVRNGRKNSNKAIVEAYNRANVDYRKKSMEYYISKAKAHGGQAFQVLRNDEIRAKIQNLLKNYPSRPPCPTKGGKGNRRKSAEAVAQMCGAYCTRQVTRALVFTSGYANPELEPNSGHILYVENRRPISRASDQTEDIKIVVEF